MKSKLNEVVKILTAHAPELRQRGIGHAAVFGSVVRGEAGPNSDVDVLIDLDPAHPMGVFEYTRLELDVAELLGNACDVVNRKTLNPALRDNILREAIDVF